MTMAMTMPEHIPGRHCVSDQFGSNPIILGATSSISITAATTTTVAAPSEHKQKVDNG